MAVVESTARAEDLARESRLNVLSVNVVTFSFNTYHVTLIT